MRVSPWLTLRQVKEALRAGRPEEAHRLLEPLMVDGHRRAWKRAREVASAYVAAGEKAVRADDPETAWQKLLAAEALNTGDPRTSTLRQSLTRLALAECRAALEAGHPNHVTATVTRLRTRNAKHPDFDILEWVAQDWRLAAEMADRGDFLLACASVDKLRNKLGTIPDAGLVNFHAEIQKRNEACKTSMDLLNDAAQANDWTIAAERAAEVIAVAPNHREARNVQFQVWGKVQPVTQPYVPESDIVELVTPPSSHSPAKWTGVPKRFLLWIDGVGGYLVCLAPRVSFGQATAEGPVDVPLLADLSRLHAEISRDGDGYILESGRGILVNGTTATRTALKPGDRITLGTTCQFVFHRPVEISPSVRLELVSGHRLQIAVDGVLLMAESLILGSSAQSHVVIPWLEEPVVLYRSKDGVGVRIKGDFRVDEKAETNRAMLSLPAVVSSSQLHFALEQVESSK